MIGLNYGALQTFLELLCDWIGDSDISPMQTPWGEHRAQTHVWTSFQWEHHTGCRISAGTIYSFDNTRILPVGRLETGHLMISRTYTGGA